MEQFTVDLTGDPNEDCIRVLEAVRRNFEEVLLAAEGSQEVEAKDGAEALGQLIDRLTEARIYKEAEEIKLTIDALARRFGFTRETHGWEDLQMLVDGHWEDGDHKVWVTTEEAIAEAIELLKKQ